MWESSLRGLGHLPRAADMTAAAMGAATRPPVTLSPRPGWLSTITATATLGASAGAKAISQAWALLPMVWAVPVLAATTTPGTAARVAVPLATTPTIMSRSLEAVCDEVAWTHGRGCHVWASAPSL